MKKKERIHNPVFYASDTETLTPLSKTYQERARNGENGKTDVYLISLLKIEDVHQKEPQKHVKQYTNLNDYFKDIFKILEENGSVISPVIYFHNLSFDGDFLIKWLIRSNYKYIPKYLEPSEYSKHFDFLQAGKNIYEIKINHTWKYKRKTKNGIIRIRCSLKILSTSIGKLGKAFNMNKTEALDELLKLNIVKPNYENGEPKPKYVLYNEIYGLGEENLHITNPVVYDILARYNVQDTLILALALDKFNNTVINQFLGDKENPYTIFVNKRTGDKKYNMGLHNFKTIAKLAKRMGENAIYHYDRTHNTNYGKYINISKNVYKDEEKAKLYYADAKFSYRGGITQFNVNYQSINIKKQGISCDINSSYPFQATQLLPLNNTKYTKEQLNPELKYVKMYDVYMKFHIKKDQDGMYFIYKPKQHMMNKNPNLTQEQWEELEKLKNVAEDLKENLNQILGEKQINHRYLKSGEGRYLIWAEELEIWEKFYDIEYVYKKEFYYQAEEVLKDWIEYYYDLRQKAAEQKDEAFKQCIKILLNSAYGGWAERVHYDTEIINNINYYQQWKANNCKPLILTFGDAQYQYKFTKDKYYILDKCTSNCDPDFCILHKLYIHIFTPLYEKNKRPNALIASRITAMGRVQLMKCIYELGVKNVYYCDTDSIFFKWKWKFKDGKYEVKNLEKLNKIFERAGYKIDNNILGGWKIENYYDNIFIRGAKDYSIRVDKKIIKSAMSGVKPERSYEEYTKIFNLFEEAQNLNSYSEILQIDNASLRYDRNDANGTVLLWVDKVKKLGSF